MIDLGRVVGFDRDSGNDRKNDRYGVSRSEAEQAFFDPGLLVVADERYSAAEPRFHGLGMTAAGRLLHGTFTLRLDGTKIRVISARDASRKERMHHEQAT